MTLAVPAQTDEFDQVQWIVEEISVRNYPVLEDGTWPGRMLLVVAVSKQFSVSDEKASELIDQAIKRLFSRQADAAPQVNVRLALAKIDRHERIILDLLSTPRQRIEYELVPRMDENNQYQRDGNGNVVVDKIPTKCTEHMEVPVALHRYLIDLQKLRVQILSIRETGKSMNDATKLIDALFAASETGGELLDTKMSVSQKIKRMDGATLDEKSLQRKKIHSKASITKVLPDKPASASGVNGNGQDKVAAPGPMPDGESKPFV